nr:MAG TPA: hypothetical protein [Caudoviricetes sp.]
MSTNTNIVNAIFIYALLGLNISEITRKSHTICQSTNLVSIFCSHYFCTPLILSLIFLVFIFIVIIIFIVNRLVIITSIERQSNTQISSGILKKRLKLCICRTLYQETTIFTCEIINHFTIS